jgi:hypothetical protein
MLLNALLKDKEAFEIKTFEIDNAPISFYSQNLQQDIV